MSLPATTRPPKDFKELEWQQQHWQPERTENDDDSTGRKNKNGPTKKIVLPFYGGSRSKYSRYVEVNTESSFGTMKIKKAKPIIPGWLIELKDYYLRGGMDIKSCLSDVENQNPRSIIETLGKIIREDMKINVSDADIFNVLRWIPMDCEGCFSFPHFMFGMGNPTMAQKSGIFMLNERRFGSRLESDYGRRRSNSLVISRADDQSGGDRRRSDGSVNEDKKRLSQAQKETANENETQGPDPNKPDDTGYNLREKVFFSGLLIFEMYETLKDVESLYAMSKIPEPVSQTLERNRRRGFGIETIGFKKFKEAAWDKPPPPLPKVSPYLATIPFVTARWNTFKPGPHDKLKRTFSKLQPLHLAIRPPRKDRQPICITENQTRIRQALAYLAAQGDCVALLPDIHFVIHLSDTDVDKLEIVTIRQSPEGTPPPHISQSEERKLIMTEVLKLFNPLIIPPQITKLSGEITYSDGLKLRDICKHLERDHWNCISMRKLEFREKAWSQMLVDEMPLGRLRDSFIYAFVTYLPFISHLPIHATKNYI